ncbi:serine hydrolase [Clavibacter sp. VKM Ac-2873]|uniref:serine hydrolase n=1 Tax=Clavibacter sp. VKM Ac-2873 TaxID=2783813 RepID=UPI00188C02E2|nr:serine hydrolase [Clavibacter sp. VKM Ac-2873]MBF4618532.1 serine hydrolase [Clavibacter sp. VKM Ac-2873]
MAPSSPRPPRPSRRARAATALALAAVTALATACSASPAEPATPAPAAEPVVLPGSLVGQQAQWLLDTVNAEDAVPVQETGERLAQVMLDAASAEDIAAVLEQVRAGRPWTATAHEEQGPRSVTTITSADAGAFDMQVAVDDAGLIQGLFFGEAEGDREPATSWAELEEQAAALGGDVSLTVTHASGGELGERILEVLPDGVRSTDARPIGSIVKLYVLGALVEAVEAGRIGWDDPLTVTDDVRSLPSGELQDAPTGTVVSVREAAGKMISISDNTATDMVIRAVGRERVEAALADLGHSDPPRNVPLMTTRDLFRIGWQDDGALLARWADGDAAERRALLDALPGGTVDVPVAAVTDVVWTRGADWFATPDDIARAHLRLAELAATPAGEPVRGILAANPGLPDPERFDHVAFKGGSSVGTLALSYLVDGGDGTWTVVVQAAARATSDLERQSAYAGLAADAAALLADGSRG